jgi:hypothetical protein
MVKHKFATMSIYFLLFVVPILLLIIRFLFKINRNNSTKTISNNNIDSTPNIEVNSNATEPESPIDSVVHPNKKQNSYLNPNENFGTLKKGVVLDNQTYEYEVKENDSSNFSIIELGDESKEICE